MTDRVENWNFESEKKKWLLQLFKKIENLYLSEKSVFCKIIYLKLFR
ncbi:MAG: hypothetical protein LBS50_10425 [Prevotellaceae bacterium]|nr:hypothetical protein [Prevotellaceae bacterium]